MSLLGIVLVVILVLVLAGGIGGPYVGAPWPRGYGVVGNGGLGILGAILIIILILALFGRI